MELHQMHNDYPLAPEKLEVQKEWLSKYQHNLMTTSSCLKVKKLVPNLRGGLGFSAADFKVNLLNVPKY